MNKIKLNKIKDWRNFKMSANQWIICGKCREYVEKKLKDSYGKITEEKITN